jgi:hypothetical protein
VINPGRRHHDGGDGRAGVPVEGPDLKLISLSLSTFHFWPLAALDIRSPSVSTAPTQRGAKLLELVLERPWRDQRIYKA